MMSVKCKYSIPYDPLTAGSIDGTDTIPHDNAVYRAMNSVYTPPKKSKSYVIFVGRLPISLMEEDLERKMSKAGSIKRCRIIRDIVTGRSRGYGFVEYFSKESALTAYYEFNGLQFNGKPAIVDWEVSSSLDGWIPRRLGGGWGGKKESGQLRFGCRDRPWHKPIIIPQIRQHSSNENQFPEQGYKKDQF